jgi:hypothetical protein
VGEAAAARVCAAAALSAALCEGAGANENLRARKNVVKMLIGCVAVYFMCYSPIQIIFVFHVLKLSPPMFTHVRNRFLFIMCVRVQEMALVLNALALGCSAANPLLYTLFSARFRQRFVALLTCRQSAQAVKSRNPSMRTEHIRRTCAHTVRGDSVSTCRQHSGTASTRHFRRRCCC